MTNTARKKLCLIVFAALFALAAVSVEVFVFTSLDHDHIDAHCPACLEMQNARQLLEGLACFTAAAFAAGFPGAAAGRQIPIYEKSFVLLQSPVALKVRFNS
ncbi:MAG: hypothetical protein LBD48_00625 [Treponema sp.]|jgi:hypothetical protein|nr:hypothetical protein [Treponema sp.]